MAADHMGRNLARRNGQTMKVRESSIIQAVSQVRQNAQRKARLRAAKAATKSSLLKYSYSRSRNVVSESSATQRVVDDTRMAHDQSVLRHAVEKHRKQRIEARCRGGSHTCRRRRGWFGCHDARRARESLGSTGRARAPCGHGRTHSERGSALAHPGVRRYRLASQRADFPRPAAAAARADDRR